MKNGIRLADALYANVCGGELNERWMAEMERKRLRGESQEIIHSMWQNLISNKS